MSEFYIDDSQFNGLDSDAPDQGIIIEALKDVADKLDSEGVWCCKGNYQMHFWSDEEKPQTIFSNAFVLSNPDDPNDSTTENYSYYFEIKRAS
jgi:hypothetical protein